ncbi:MAG: hypothetical protein V1787_00535 [Candidatus Micrarchaeota archaeon]
MPLDTRKIALLGVVLVSAGAFIYFARLARHRKRGAVSPLLWISGACFAVSLAAWLFLES